jgi:hypothetical protein
LRVTEGGNLAGFLHHKCQKVRHEEFAGSDSALVDHMIPNFFVLYSRTLRHGPEFSANSFCRKNFVTKSRIAAFRQEKLTNIVQTPLLTLTKQRFRSINLARLERLK